MLGVVRQPASPEAFPGLYATSLPERPFVDGGAAVLLNSSWGNRGVIIRVELGSGGVLLFSDAEEAPGSWTMLDTDGGVPLFPEHRNGPGSCASIINSNHPLQACPSCGAGCRPPVQAGVVHRCCCNALTLRLDSISITPAHEHMIRAALACCWAHPYRRPDPLIAFLVVQIMW